MVKNAGSLDQATPLKRNYLPFRFPAALVPDKPHVSYFADAGFREELINFLFLGKHVDARQQHRAVVPLSLFSLALGLFDVSSQVILLPFLLLALIRARAAGASPPVMVSFCATLTVVFVVTAYFLFPLRPGLLLRAPGARPASAFLTLILELGTLFFFLKSKRDKDSP